MMVRHNIHTLLHGNTVKKTEDKPISNVTHKLSCIVTEDVLPSSGTILKTQVVIF